MISHMLSIYDLLVLTDSEDGCPERDDVRPLDHYEEIDMDDQLETLIKVSYVILSHGSRLAKGSF